jgi:hypothetical protein
VIIPTSGAAIYRWLHELFYISSFGRLTLKCVQNIRVPAGEKRGHCLHLLKEMLHQVVYPLSQNQYPGRAGNTELQVHFVPLLQLTSYKITSSSAQTEGFLSRRVLLVG